MHTNSIGNGNSYNPLIDQILEEGGFEESEANIISWANNYFLNKTPEEKLMCAVKHVKDALSYRNLRVYRAISDGKDQSTLSCTELCYQIQTSQKWRQFLLIMSYIFMYLICLSHARPSIPQLYLQTLALTLFWIDICLQTAHKYYSSHKNIGVSSFRNCIKFVIVFLLTFDQVYSVTAQDVIYRPFIILRVVMPTFFDASLRKKIMSVFRLYKDFIAYIIVYSIALFCFAIVTTQFVQLPQDQQLDNFTQNYRSLSQTMVIFYVLSSYDCYPDNQLKPIRHQPHVYVIFILFIFMSVLIFTTIPNTFLFEEYKKHYARQILVQQIQQQHSLVFAFIALSNKQMKIPINKFTSFMFTLYRNNSKYVGYITQICIQINHHKNEDIQMSEFMQLCKIMHANKSMLPPTYIEFPLWNKFRSLINQKIGIKDMVRNHKFQIIVSVLTLLSIINCILFFYHIKFTALWYLLDRIFTCLFLVQVIIKILGQGVQNFFRGSLNLLDLFLLCFMLVQQTVQIGLLTPNQIPILKFLRFHRIFVTEKEFMNRNLKKRSFYIKACRLINQFMTIFPIIKQFLPLFAMVSYCLGVFGMFIFRYPPSITPQQSNYSKYDQFSNFRSFIFSQFIIIQILVEAGWSSVLFDQVYRYGYAFFITLYFLFCHLLIVFVLTPLFKGVIWGIYQIINEDINNRSVNLLSKQRKAKLYENQKQKLLKMSNQTKLNKQIDWSNLMSRRVLEQKIDSLIIKSMKAHNQHVVRPSKQLDYGYLENIQDLQKEDIEQFIAVISQYIVVPTKYFSEVQCPKILETFLLQKLKTNKQQFWVDEFENIRWPQESIRTIKDELHNVMGIKTFYNKQLIRNISEVLLENGVGIENVQILADALVKKKQIEKFFLNKNYVIRKTFMKDTNQKLVQTFQMELLQQVYPNHINSIVSNISPKHLLLHQSRALYTLTNILRYPQIGLQQFFHLFVGIQNYITTNMLKKGSLFKFVFKLSQSNTWFTIQSMVNKVPKLRFLKNSVWIWNQQFKERRVYFSNDFFNCGQQFQGNQNNIGKSLVKMLFQGFQTLAISLNSRDNFFSFEPSQRIYDLYFMCFNIKQVDTNLNNCYKFPKINKAMTILLSNQEQRDQPLNYDLTKMQKESRREDVQQKWFRIDQDESETFEKIRKKQMCEDDHTSNLQGLSFTFLVNLFAEIKDIIGLHEKNLVAQIQKLIVQQLQ